MLAMRHRSWSGILFSVSLQLAAGLYCSSSFAQSTTKRPAAADRPATPKRVAQVPETPARPAPLKVAQNRDDAPDRLEAPPVGRDPSRKVMQVASLSAEEIKAKQSTSLRKSMTVYVPKLVNERQNVTRTIMTPVTSHELRPVWSPGQGKWVSYRPTGQTIWAPRTEVVTMDVPVWKYVAETRYIEEPIVRQNYYTPIQSSPAAWAWAPQGGAGVQPLIPPAAAPRRPVLTFLQNRPLVGRLFGGGRPVFPPAPAPIGPVSANYQPVSYYQPAMSGANYTAPIGGPGVPGFTAPQLPVSGTAGNYGGVRVYQ